MSRDAVALLAEAPARGSLIDALVEAGPDLRVRSVSEGAVIELRDGSGRLVAAMQAAQRLALSAEADRLLAEGVSDDGRPEGVRERDALPFAGTQRVGTVPDGVRESVTFAVGHQPGEKPDLSGLSALFRALTAEEALRSITVQRLLGRPDLTYAPRWSGPPVPVGLAVGVEGVSTMGTGHALSAPVRGIPIGPPLTPAVWYLVGHGTEPDSWDRSRDLMSHLRPAD